MTLAVVVHLYYVDMWKQIRAALEPLDGYDLYVTTPHPVDARRAVGRAGRVIWCRNHGRDVLPFLKAGRKIEHDHPTFLKLHTKRSPHWDGGAQWMSDMLSALVPPNPAGVLATLAKPDTGLIGPAEHFFSLRVWYEETRHHVERMFGPIDPAEHGFFAGSMFWGRFDAITPLLRLPNRSFEQEHGQESGTMAHAVERAFSLRPAIDGRRLYEVGPDGVQPVGAPTYPAWSDVQPG